MFDNWYSIACCRHNYGIYRQKTEQPKLEEIRRRKEEKHLDKMIEEFHGAVPRE